MDWQWKINCWRSAPRGGLSAATFLKYLTAIGCKEVPDTMTQGHEDQEAGGRLAVLFSECPANMYGKGHVWNVDSKCCQRCGAAFPYGEQGKVTGETK